MFTPGFTMYATAAENIKRETCKFCGHQLDPHQAVSTGICAAPECHAKMIEQVGTDLMARRRKQHAEYVEELLGTVEAEVSAALTELDAAADDTSIAVLPWQNKPVVPLAQERSDAFRAHLEEITAIAFANPIPETDLAYRDEQEEAEEPVSASACATCQGMCCFRGGNTGLLCDTEVMRHRQRHPDVTPEQVIDLYMSHLPDSSTADACVYQSATGCTLPRDLRHDICNSYYCDSLRWLHDDYMKRKTGKVVYVAADDDAPKAVAVFDLTNGRRSIARVADGPDQAG